MSKHNRDHSRDQSREHARQVVAWFQSEPGKSSVSASAQRVRETAEKLQQGRDIDPAKLHEPFTV
jgi:hypothetical protein